ncbi:MAG TPA: thioredoxin-dependent thiol peroxidase [Candidatus Doudnabacteria bacterium]|nr:thioredoxin-dependent thiol peroxidase [Candidatus Doudnabacteria bacterium]
MLKEQQKAPDFTLPDQDGKKHKLSDYKGQWVLLYFYPKDNTPGCTTEACALRDNFPAFKKVKAKVFGISTDSVTSHKKFADKYELPFTLLADEEKSVVEKYDVWRVKNMYGRKFFGIARVSFLISPDGKIAKIYEKVKPAVHAEEVLEDIKKLSK